MPVSNDSAPTYTVALALRRFCKCRRLPACFPDSMLDPWSLSQQSCQRGLWKHVTIKPLLSSKASWDPHIPQRKSQSSFHISFSFTCRVPAPHRLCDSLSSYCPLQPSCPPVVAGTHQAQPCIRFPASAALVPGTLVPWLSLWLVLSAASAPLLIAPSMAFSGDPN